MSAGIQAIITLAFVGGAALYLGVSAWRFYRRAASGKESGCGGCGGRKRTRKVRLEPPRRRGP